MTAQNNTEELTLMSSERVARSLRRMAFEILEVLSTKERILLVGLNNRGFSIANNLAEILRSNSSYEVSVLQMKEDKFSDEHVTLSDDIIVVDDVIFSGGTMLRAINKIYEKSQPETIRIAALIDRGHRKFPLSAQFTGLHYPTKLREHVRVDVKNAQNITVILEHN